MKVAVPKKLSKEQKKAVEELAKLLPADHVEQATRETNAEKPFFERVKDIFG